MAQDLEVKKQKVEIAMEDLKKVNGGGALKMPYEFTKAGQRQTEKENQEYIKYLESVKSGKTSVSSNSSNSSNSSKSH